MTTARDLIIETKRLIKDRATWTRDAAARDKNDNIVNITSPTACKFCVTGAVERARLNLCLEEGSKVEHQARQLLRETSRRMVGYSSIVTVNDEQGFVAIHGVLDDAIINASLKA